MFERQVTHHALTLVAAVVVVVIVDEMRTKPPQHRQAGGERSDRAAQFKRLLVVDFGFLVVLAVVDAHVQVAVVGREGVVERGACIRRRHDRRKWDALGENGALESVAIDAFFEIDPRRLLDAQPCPRAPRHPIVEVELGVRVLEAKFLTT